MSYSENLASTVTKQFERFITLNNHQLAGHVGNLEFWIGEACHALAVLDGYESRFRNLKAGQQAYVAQHRTVSLDCGTPPFPPTRVPDADRLLARRSLIDAVYRFLIRCFRAGLIDESRLREACAKVGTSVDPGDVQND